MAYGIIKIGEKEVPVRATAATPIRYRQVFHKNLLPYFYGTNGAKDEEYAEMVGELTYIMARSAEGADMTKLSEEDYLQWLEAFDPLDIASAESATSVLNFYSGGAFTHEDVKKSPAQQSGK